MTTAPAPPSLLPVTTLRRIDLAPKDQRPIDQNSSSNVPAKRALSLPTTDAGRELNMASVPVPRSTQSNFSAS